jgi:hypothetical protein
MRELDAFDYAVVFALTLLAYLELPWRPSVRGLLRWLAGMAWTATAGREVELAVAGFVLVGVAFLAMLVRGGPEW